MASGMENLRVPSSEEAREIGRKGGQKSAENRRRKRAIREICADLLAMEAPQGAAELGELTQVAQKLAEERGQPLDLYEVMTLAQVAQAMAGNTKAAVFVRDSAGDKPADDVQVSTGMTDADRQLMANVAARLQQKDKNRQE